MEEAINQLIDVHPLLCVQKGNHPILLDFVDLVFLVHELLALDPAAQSSDSTVRAASAICRHTSNGVFFHKRPGPIPLQKSYLEILTVMINFAQLNGFGAHIQRHTGTSTSHVVGLKDICKHILENVDGLNEISLRTC